MSAKVHRGVSISGVGSNIRHKDFHPSVSSPSSVCNAHSTPTEFLSAVGWRAHCLVQVNASEVCQAGPWSPEKGIKLEAIGCSVGSSLALVNHSCCPNTVLARRGATAILLTTANIKKGQEVRLLLGRTLHPYVMDSFVLPRTSRYLVRLA